MLTKKHFFCVLIIRRYLLTDSLFWQSWGYGVTNCSSVICKVRGWAVPCNETCTCNTKISPGNFLLRI